MDTELAGGITPSSSFGAAPESVWLEKAKKHYAHGDYGLAERFYRQAIEERHNNAEAWLGLAASYDRLKRFDLADRAYDALIKLVGYTPTVLNNLAYHQMLRGDLRGGAAKPRSGGKGRSRQSVCEKQYEPACRVGGEGRQAGLSGTPKRCDKEQPGDSFKRGQRWLARRRAPPLRSAGHKDKARLAPSG